MKKVFLILILFCQSLRAQEDVDYLALAKLLVRDGHFARAEKMLIKVQPRSSEKALVESLWGVVSLNKKKYQKAIDHFNKSLKLGLKNKEVYIYLSEGYLNLDKISLAETSLAKTGPVEKSKLPYFLLKAEIFWEKGAKEQAWRILNVASGKKLSPGVLAKKRFSYLIQEGLFRVGYELAVQEFQRGGHWREILAMASQLRLNKQFGLSLHLLQMLALQKPNEESLALEMTQNYLSLGQNYSAALILEEAARVEPSLSFEASALLRQVGKNYRARYLNFQTLDPKKRLKQKMALYLESDNYHSMKLMLPEIKKHQLLQDEELRYAVAYSLYKTGDFKLSENYLKQIERDDLFEKSARLLDEINKCKKSGWACSETI